MKCTINDIANVISESIPNPAESGYDIFVGLEHYDSGEVKITRYGSTDSLVTAVKVFKKGDILLARRNVYLKRAGLVDFDGVTSGDSIVLRVKPDLSKLGTRSSSVQKYLPFVLNTEEFWNYAEKYSDGTMSKRLSPKTLLQYEFEIPDDVDNKNDLLWSAFETKESYRTMIKAIDEMVKSQFIEMFGDARRVPIGSIFSTTSGGTPSRAKNDFFDGGTIPWLTSSEVGQGRIRKTESFITENGLKNSSAKWVPKNSVVVAMYGATVGKVGLLEIPCTTNQAVCCILPNEAVNPMYLFYAVKNKEEWMVSQAAGAAQPNISQSVIRKMEVPMPSLDEQELFDSIAGQADKSKYLN